MEEPAWPSKVDPLTTLKLHTIKHVSLAVRSTYSTAIQEIVGESVRLLQQEVEEREEILDSPYAQILLREKQRLLFWILHTVL